MASNRKRGGKKQGAPQGLQDLKAALAESKADLKALSVDDLPDMPIFDLSQETTNFGKREPFIMKQLGNTETNFKVLGGLLMDAHAARGLAGKLDEMEQQIFDYVTTVVPTDWINERRHFFVEVMRLMIRYYPPYVWGETEAEDQSWILEKLSVDPEKVELGDEELLARIQCVESAHQSLPRIGAMGLKLGVFQEASSRDLPQQRIRIKAPVGSSEDTWQCQAESCIAKGMPVYSGDPCQTCGAGVVKKRDRMEVTDLTCHFHGSAGLTQPLRHMIELMRMNQKAAFRDELEELKAGADDRFLEALDKEDAISWFHLEDEKFKLKDGNTGTLPGGFIRVKIVEGLVYPVAAIGRIARTKRWKALMEDMNKPCVAAGDVGEERCDTRGMDADTRANTRYFHGVLNRAHNAQVEAQKVSEEGEKKRNTASISMHEWLHPAAMSVGSAFTHRPNFRFGRKTYAPVEVLVERNEDSQVRVAWCNEESKELFDGAFGFADEESQPRAFQVFLNVTHKDLDLPDLE